MKNSLKSVCLRHNINFSSAKNVLQIYRKEGRLEKKMFRERRNRPNPLKQKDASSSVSNNEEGEED
jgi:hypothetical protein